MIETLERRSASSWRGTFGAFYQYLIGRSASQEMMRGTAEQRLHRLDRHFAGPQIPRLTSSAAGIQVRSPRPPSCLQYQQLLTLRRRALDAYNQEQRKPRLALVTTVWFAGKPPTADSPGEHGTPSHSVHMGDRFLTGWPMGGEVSIDCKLLSDKSGSLRCAAQLFRLN